jgi:hypothetical protein
MRRALILALGLCAAAPGQRIVNANRVGALVAQLEGAQTEETALGCEVSATRPSLNFGFRYQAGYVATVPMRNYTGSGHRWTLLTRITPADGDRKPVYLISRITLPDVQKTKADGRVGGGYLLGEGAYDVRWMMRDDAGRVCRKSWHVTVHRSHAERQVKVAIPPDTVWDFGRRGLVPAQRETDDARAQRLTILLHTAPLLPRRTRLRPGDIMTLMSTVSTLVERVPARSVRLVLFNLDQQKELYRKEGFLLRDMAEVSEAMSHIELGMVDFEVLRNKHGPVDLLTDLVNREIMAQPASNVVLFLGPQSRYSDRVPRANLEKVPGHPPQFYYFQIVPFAGQMAQLPDTIESAISRLGGKRWEIHTPGDFARAIERLEKSGPGAR